MLLSRLFRTFSSASSLKVPGLLHVSGKANAPAVIVLQEWWGITDQVKAHAAVFQKEGYTTFIPDLYRGKIGVDAEEANHLMSNLDWNQALLDIETAAKYLKTNNGRSSCFAFGCCMGGSLSLNSVLAYPNLIDASAVFYGVGQEAIVAVREQLKKPVQAHFGALDNINGFSDKTTALALKDSLEYNNKVNQNKNEFYLYDTEGHAFMNDLPEFVERRKNMGFGSYNEQAVKLAWSRVLKFFKMHI